MTQKFEVEVEAPKKLQKGDKFTVEVEVELPEAPAKEVKSRGQLAGIAIEDMTDEQLKREIINASSVLYKATQRGAAATTIAANQLRVDAAKAEKAKRAGATETPAVDAPNVEASFSEEVPESGNTSVGTEDVVNLVEDGPQTEI